MHRERYNVTAINCSEVRSSKMNEQHDGCHQQAILREHRAIASVTFLLLSKSVEFCDTSLRI